MKVFTQKLAMLFTGLFLVFFYDNNAQTIKSKELFADNNFTITVEAKFIKRTRNGSCDYAMSSETNMFELIKSKNGVFVNKSFEVEYLPNCYQGNKFIPDHVYLLQLKKLPETRFYRNVKTTPLQ